MANLSDRRVRKTRKALRGALEELMRIKSVGDITVKELCAASDINRSTFYLHYRDVAELLRAVEAELLEEFETVIEPLTSTDAFAGSSPSPYMAAVFEFLARNAGMCRVLLCSGGDAAFLDRVTEFVRRRLVGEYGPQASARGSETPQYAFVFVVSGCIGMLQRWLESDTPLSPVEMAGLVEDILRRGISALREA